MPRLASSGDSRHTPIGPAQEGGSTVSTTAREPFQQPRGAGAGPRAGPSAVARGLSISRKETDHFRRMIPERREGIASGTLASKDCLPAAAGAGLGPGCCRLSPVSSTSWKEEANARCVVSNRLYVCTPADDHASTPRAATEVGVRRIVVEQPCAAPAADVDEMRRIADRTGASVAVINPYPYGRSFSVRSKRLYPSGLRGPVVEPPRITEAARAQGRCSGSSGSPAGSHRRRSTSTRRSGCCGR